MVTYSKVYSLAIGVLNSDTDSLKRLKKKKKTVSLNLV